MNAVFREVFPKDPPTRSTIIVPQIAMNAAVEVECTALAVDLNDLRAIVVSSLIPDTLRWCHRPWLDN
jgi:hypothetical protein